MVTCNWGRWDKSVSVGERLELLDRLIDAVGHDNAKAFVMNIATLIENEDLFKPQHPLQVENYKGIRAGIDNTIPDKVIYLLPKE
jgi:hypothetical protein